MSERLPDIELQDFHLDSVKVIPGNILNWSMIVLYETPTDYPGDYVARLWSNNKPTPFMVRRSSEAELIQAIPSFMARLAPEPFDDPNIISIFI